MGSTDIDGYYNACRLLFHVYNQYFKVDGINIYILKNIDSVLTGDSNSVVQDLSSIVIGHEQALMIAESKDSSRISSDLLFNLTLLYTEIIEVEQNNLESNDIEKILQVGNKSQEMFKKLIESQITDLNKFIIDLNQANNENVSTLLSSARSSQPQPKNEEQRQEEYTSEDIMQPTDIFETILNGYKLVQAQLENVSHPNEITTVLDNVNPFIQFLETALLELNNQFNLKPDALAGVTTEQQNEFILLRQYIIGLSTNDWELIHEGWITNESLPKIPETYMLAADNVQTFIDRNDLTTENEEYGEMYWKCLTFMDSRLKIAQTILSDQVNEKKKVPSGEDNSLSSLISQLSEIMIARSDIELQRCQLSIPIAIKNSEIIFKNSKVFLKNAMNIANTSGGLREKVSDKLTREYRKSQAVLRLCLLEGKISIEELDNILGRERWHYEIPNLIKLEFFTKFGINEIHLE